jgi:hypothetical protein
MAGGIASFPSGVQATGLRGTATLSTNNRVRTSMGSVMLVTDVVLFSPPPMSGIWLIPNQRVFVNGVPTIGQTSIGMVPYLNGQFPMTVVQADSRVSAI